MVILAILPALLLLIWIYRMDGVEKEPKKLILKTFLFGVISLVPVLLVELILDATFLSFFQEGTPAYLIADNFVGVAIVEEYAKMKSAKLAVWKRPEFDYQFDAIVYCVTSALGYATAENVMYVFGSDIGTTLSRGIFSVPSHMVDGVLMGYFFGRAKTCEKKGKGGMCRWYLFLSVLVPSVEHGIYDGCLSSESSADLLFFIFFVIVVYIWAFWFVRRQAAHDAPL